jgi:hypothetical protein
MSPTEAEDPGVDMSEPGLDTGKSSQLSDIKPHRKEDM